jgi:hypothetical protein
MCDSADGGFTGEKALKMEASLRRSGAGNLDGNVLTRDEHLAWCKGRALEYLGAGDLGAAVASMGSDLRAHSDTDNPALDGLVSIGMMYVTDGDKASVQRWIERFS